MLAVGSGAGAAYHTLSLSHSHSLSLSHPLSLSLSLSAQPSTLLAVSCMSVLTAVVRCRRIRPPRGLRRRLLGSSLDRSEDY